MTKEKPGLQKQTGKKTIREENTVTTLMLKNYICIISAGKTHRTESIAAKSKAEAEKIMLEKYGDLKIECVKVEG